MSATEFYNSLLKVTKQSGQGVPGIIFKQKISSILDEIIRLKKIGKKDYTKEKTELEEVEQELIKRQELNLLLLLKNKNKQIQEIL